MFSYSELNRSGLVYFIVLCFTMKCSKKVDCDLSEPSENEATFLDQWLLSIGQTKPITFRKRQIRNNDRHFTYIILLFFD